MTTINTTADAQGRDQGSTMMVKACTTGHPERPRWVRVRAERTATAGLVITPVVCLDEQSQAVYPDACQLVHEVSGWPVVDWRVHELPLRWLRWVAAELGAAGIDWTASADNLRARPSVRRVVFAVFQDAFTTHQEQTDPEFR